MHPLDYIRADCVGRQVKNAFDQLEVIALPPRYWDYLAWTYDMGLDPEAWIKECDSMRGDNPLEVVVAHFLYEDFNRRVENGEPLPPWLPRTPASGDFDLLH